MTFFTAATTRHDTTDNAYPLDNFFLASTYSQPQQQVAYQKCNKQPATAVTASSSSCSSNAVNSQSNSMAYDCLPHQQQHPTVSAIPPLENLSINQQQRSLNSSDWNTSPLELNYPQYNQPDMNCKDIIHFFLFCISLLIFFFSFVVLFAYNDLISSSSSTSQKDLSNNNIMQYNSTPPSESSASANEEIKINSNLEFQPSLLQINPNKGGAEQYRRFSMMDMSSIHKATTVDSSSSAFNYPSYTVQPSPHLRQPQQQQRVVNSNPYMNFAGNDYNQPAMMVHKERSSMLNVFISHQPQHPLSVSTNNNIDYTTQQQQHPLQLLQQQEQQAIGQLTWQQSSLLQKRPAVVSSSSLTSTPIEEASEYNFLIKNGYSSSPTTTVDFKSSTTPLVTSSISSPLIKKHHDYSSATAAGATKKRSMIEEVLHEDLPFAMSTSVVSSLSEPIPTTASSTATSSWMYKQQQHQHHVARKRTKSIHCTTEADSILGEPIIDSISPSSASSCAIVTESQQQQQTTVTTLMENDLMIDNVQQQQQMMDHRQHDNYNILSTGDILINSDPAVASSHGLHHSSSSAAAMTTADFDFSNGTNTNQVLAAMPRRQKLRYEGDHYTPKWVRYTGHLKEGYCDSCHPGKWLQLKNSAYW